jgi:regulator of protease activity HflC (stomatin/prohibitin superfamily)
MLEKFFLWALGSFVVFAVAILFVFFPKTMLIIIGCLFGVFLVAGILYLLGYYFLLFLARCNILLTIVEEGWCKIVLEKGQYHKTIYSGWHWFGLPGINTLYKRTMTFMKSVTDKEGKAFAEAHEDKDISSFKTTEYPYACPFKDEEDSHGLHLSGVLATFARIIDYRKAFFEVSDWYSEMNTKILSCLRKVIAEVSYDDDIVGRDKPEEQINPTFSERLWEKLNHKQNSSFSIIEELREICGIEVRSVELRSIDPPEDWRATTLAPYKAQREKEAAKHQAEASATLLDDTNQALKTWLESQRAIGNEPTKSEIAEKQNELARRAYLKAGGQYQEIHGLENANVVGFGGGGGGGLGILASNQRKNPGRGDRSQSRKDPGKMSAEDLDKEIEND